MLFFYTMSFLSKQHRIELSHILKTINNSQFQCVNWNSAKRRNYRRFPIKRVEVKSIRVKQTFSSHSPNHTTGKKNIYINDICLKLKKRISPKIGRVLKASSMYRQPYLSCNNYQDHPGPDVCTRGYIRVWRRVKPSIGQTACYMHIQGECFH